MQHHFSATNIAFFSKHTKKNLKILETPSNIISRLSKKNLALFV